MTRVFTDAVTSDRSSRINCEQLYSLLMYRQVLEIRQFHILNGKWPKACCKNNPRVSQEREILQILFDWHIYTNLPVYATIHTTGDKLSEFQERDHASKHALSGSYPNVISQFYKLVVLIFVPHPPSFFKIPALLISTGGSASETFPNLQFNSRLSHSPLSTEKRSQT